MHQRKRDMVQFIALVRPPCRERSFQFITAVIRFRRRCVFHCRAGNECICATALADECAEMMRVKSYSSGVHVACFAAAATGAQTSHGGSGGQKVTPAKSLRALGVGKTGNERESGANDAGRIAFLLTWCTRRWKVISISDSLTERENEWKLPRDDENET